MWLVSRKQRVDDKGSRSEGLVGECESFLSGRYASDLESRGESVPDWAWVNALAQSPVATVRTIAAGYLGMPLPTRSSVHWHGALVVVARELLKAAERTGCSVEEVQRSVLRDLEFRNAGIDNAGPGLDPYRFVTEATKELAQLRSTTY